MQVATPDNLLFHRHWVPLACRQCFGPRIGDTPVAPDGTKELRLYRFFFGS
jgi:hypothetical protein